MDFRALLVLVMIMFVWWSEGVDWGFTEEDQKSNSTPSIQSIEHGQPTTSKAVISMNDTSPPSNPVGSTRPATRHSVRQSRVTTVGTTPVIATTSSPSKTFESVILGATITVVTIVVFVVIIIMACRTIPHSQRLRVINCATSTTCTRP